MDIVVTNIRRIMREKGLKQRFVAKKSGFTEQEFSNMLNGRKRIDTDYINRICFALSVPPNDLFQIAATQEATTFTTNS